MRSINVMLVTCATGLVLNLVAREVPAQCKVGTARVDVSRSITFGYAPAIDGEYAVIGGMESESGSTSDAFGVAYLFKRSGLRWVLQDGFTAPDVDPDDKFGRSVAISSNT